MHQDQRDKPPALAGGTHILAVSASDLPSEANANNRVMIRASAVDSSSVLVWVCGEHGGRWERQALIDGQRDPAVLADLAKRRLRHKIPELTEASAAAPTAELHRTPLRRVARQTLSFSRRRSASPGLDANPIDRR